MYKAELFFNDLTQEARTRLMQNLSTHPDIENWDIVPLATIERETTGVRQPERVEEWQQFAGHMAAYIRKYTIAKYTVENEAIDLMSITDADVCLWNILKYALRMNNGKGKEHDIEKIAHYAQLWWVKQRRTT